jgi:hypothetical protein
LWGYVRNWRVLFVGEVSVKVTFGCFLRCALSK